MSKPDKSTGVRLVEVDEHHDGQRVDNFIMAHLKGVPRSAIYRIVRTGQVRINGKRCKPTSRLENGDQVRLPPARIREDGQPIISRRVLEQIRDATVHDQSDIMVINKPSGMAVHSGSGLPWGLVDVVRQLYPEQYIELAHRLDRETSGCLVLARSGKMLKSLSALFRTDGLEKRYLCLLDGRISQPLIDVDVPLRRNQDQAESRVIVSEDGKPAHTRFRLLQAYSDSSYVEAELFSGRTHQIRVHAQSLGLPVAGDVKYGKKNAKKRWKQRGLRRLFLHSHHLAFELPGGEAFQFNAPLPESLSQVLSGLSPSD